MTQDHYDPTSIRLHWLTAALVVLLWGVAHLIDFFPKGDPRIAARSVHILLGSALGVILLARIAWRLGRGRRLPAAEGGALGSAAIAMHWALYLLVATAVGLGIANAWIRGDTIIGLFKIPSIAPGNLVLKRTIEDRHETVANILLIAAGLHALAALAHHFLRHDAVLGRMIPRLKSRRG